MASRTRAVCTIAFPSRGCHQRSFHTNTLFHQANLNHNLISPPASKKIARSSIKNSKPLSDFLIDSFNRRHDYLRISVTERCNLRCVYCMPEEGVNLSPPAHLLTSAEIMYLSSLFVSQGVKKIRLTGGEPTVRKDIISLVKSIGSLRSRGLKELAITTNGISLFRKLDEMVEAGLTGINLSLDTLDPFQYQIMTRRAGFDTVMKTVNRILQMKLDGAELKFKINCVVMRGLNEKEIIPFVEFGRSQDVEIRFIEYMPFGGNKWNREKMVPFREMMDTIKHRYPDISRIHGHVNDTSKTYHIPGFTGTIGFITSMTNDFCSTCNRLRITSDGNLKVCLHGNTEVSLRDLLRDGSDPVTEQIIGELKAMKPGSASSAVLNDWECRERRLLDVIGAAVKRKKEKHAGMGELEYMKNRPMILIGPAPFASSLRSKESPWSYSTLSNQLARPVHVRPYSTMRSSPSSLLHLTKAGTAHMVNVSPKPSTHRRAIAIGHANFSTPKTARLVADAAIAKGDVLGIARVAGIMAAKNCALIIPLCHPIGLTGVVVDIALFEGCENCHETNQINTETNDKFGGVKVKCTVECVGPTGVEMEALSGVMGALLSVVDMVKAADKGVVINNVRVVLKEGGRSGSWKEG